MLLHYLLAVINYIHRYESGIIWETKQYACLRKLDYQKTFCSNNNSVERRKKKNFKTKEKRTASLFSREKWMFVRILPFIRFFFKDLKTWSNMIGLLWYVISNQLTFGKFRLVFFFLSFLSSAETRFGTSSTIISQDWEGLTNQTRPQVPFFNESCLFRGCFFRQHTASAKKAVGWYYYVVALTRFSCYELQFLVKWNTRRDYEYLASSSMVCLLSSR